MIEFSKENIIKEKEKRKNRNKTRKKKKRGRITNKQEKTEKIRESKYNREYNNLVIKE